MLFVSSFGKIAAFLYDRADLANSLGYNAALISSSLVRLDFKLIAYAQASRVAPGIKLYVVGVRKPFNPHY